MVHEDGLHVKDAHVPSEHISGQLPAVRPAARLTVYDAESAMLVSSLRKSREHALWLQRARAWYTGMDRM